LFCENSLPQTQRRADADGVSAARFLGRLLTPTLARQQGGSFMAVRIDAAGVRALFPEVAEIRDETLREGVLAIWLETAAQCRWSRFEDVPKNLGAEKGRRLVDHIRGVTRMALALAEIGEREHGTPYNRDHLIAICLLHDVSKPMETDPDPEGAPTGGPAAPGRKSALGEAVQHALYATHQVFAHGLPLAVAHVVNTHTHASAMRSKTIEGAYLFYADYADSDAGIFGTGAKMFVERWEIS